MQAGHICLGYSLNEIISIFHRNRYIHVLIPLLICSIKDVGLSTGESNGGKTLTI